ncbi:MAG: hypothetical protein R3256_03460 [Thalassovita sp.]|nr:hypothetical protein [Thalassovita sp.]
MPRKDDPSRLRPDGSIDIAHYTERGRKLRSEQAHRLMGRRPAQSPRRSLWGLFSVFPRFAS